MIEAELRDRKFAPIVRLEVGEGIDPVHRGMLAVELGLNEDRDCSRPARRSACAICSRSRPWTFRPCTTGASPGHQRQARGSGAQHLPHHPRHRPILLQHPYDPSAPRSSASSARPAATPGAGDQDDPLPDPSGTRIIDDLVEAARNGKQVAVVVEIKARFDEAATSVGKPPGGGRHPRHVRRGRAETHSKIVLVVAAYTGIRRYAISAPATTTPARRGSIPTSACRPGDDAIGRDLTELFRLSDHGYSRRAVPEAAGRPRA